VCSAEAKGGRDVVRGKCHYQKTMFAKHRVVTPDITTYPDSRSDYDTIASFFRTLEETVALDAAVRSLQLSLAETVEVQSFSAEIS
jgi:hypothetical protein